MSAPNHLESRLAVPAFFCTLFLFFTPFEQGGPRPSMLTEYFCPGCACFDRALINHCARNLAASRSATYIRRVAGISAAISATRS